MEAERVERLLLLGLAVLVVGLAVYVLFDDFQNSQQLRGRWARLDAALGDLEENRNIKVKREADVPSEGC
jgi:hypothetical protein